MYLYLHYVRINLLLLTFSYQFHGDDSLFSERRKLAENQHWEHTFKILISSSHRKQYEKAWNVFIILFIISIKCEQNAM